MKNDNESEKNTPARGRPGEQSGSPGAIRGHSGSNANKQILVPLDGSSLAEMALLHATALARATAGGLLLLRVVPPITLIEPMAELIGASPESWDPYAEQREDAEHYIGDIVDRLRPTGLDIQSVVTESEGSGALVGIAESILCYTREHPEIVAIAMSTHGRSGPGRWLFGSVAERILHGSPVPLLLLRSEAEPGKVNLEPALVPSYKTVLVPLDGSQLAEQALPHALALAEAESSRLVLVSVTSTPFDLKLVKSHVRGAWSAVPWDTPAERHVTYLDGVTEKLAGSGLQVQARVTYGDAAEEILKTAKYEKADIIVMATHGRSGLGHLLIGSIAGHVAQAATVPLLLVRVTHQPGYEQQPEYEQSALKADDASPDMSAGADASADIVASK